MKTKFIRATFVLIILVMVCHASLMTMLLQGIGSKLRIPLRTRASISETGPPSAAPRAPELPPRLARLAQLAHTSVPSHRVVGRKAVSASSQGSGCQDKFDAQPQPQTKARDLTRRARNRWTTPVEPKSTSGIGRQPLGNTSAG